MFNQSYQFKFKTAHSLETRKSKADFAKGKYPSRILIIVEAMDTDTRLKDNGSMKFIVPEDFLVSDMMYEIRKKMNKNPSNTITNTDALFILVNGNIMPNMASPMSSIYDSYKDEDDILYLLLTCENTFG